MTEHLERYQILAVLIYDLVLVIVMAGLAYMVTPWALLGLLFLAGYSADEEVTVTTDGGTTVTVTTEELSERDIRQTVSEAVSRE